MDSSEIGGGAAASHAILMENFDKDYNVTEEEMLEYAHEIGINCETEPNLLWIAWEGVMAPLPVDWIAIEAEDKVYYRNVTSGTTTWEHPCDSYYKKLVLNERRKPAGKEELDAASLNKKSQQNGDNKKRGEPQGAASNIILSETNTEKNLGATPKRNVHFVDSESVSEYDEWKRSNRCLSSHNLTIGSKDSLDTLDEADLEKISKGESSIGSFSAREGSGASEGNVFASKGERFDVTVERVFEESRNALRVQQADDFKKYEEMLRKELKEKKERLARELQEAMEREQKEQERILRFKMEEELKTLKLNLEEDTRVTKELLQNEHAANVVVLKKELGEEREKIVKENRIEIRAILRVLKEANEELKRLLEEDATQLRETYKTHLRNIRREQREELDRLSKECRVLMKKDTSLQMDRKVETQIGVQLKGGFGYETDVSGSLQNSVNEDGSSSAILNLRLSKMEAILERYQKRIEKLESVAEDDISVSRRNQTQHKSSRKQLSTERTSDISMISQQSQGVVDKSCPNKRLTAVDGASNNVFARIETLQQRPVYNSLEDSSKDDRSESTTTTMSSSTDGTGSSLESTSTSSSERFGSQSASGFYGTNYFKGYNAAPSLDFNNEVGRRNPTFYHRYEREGFSRYGGRNPSPFSSTSYLQNDWLTYTDNPITNTEEGLRRQKEWLKREGVRWRGQDQNVQSRFNKPISTPLNPVVDFQK